MKIALFGELTFCIFQIPTRRVISKFKKSDINSRADSRSLSAEVYAVLSLSLNELKGEISSKFTSQL